MKIDLLAYERAFAALPKSVREAEVCADLREELLISVKDGVREAGSSFSRTTLYLRASGDKTGTVLSEKLDEDPYSLMEKALANAAFSRADRPEPLNTGDDCRIVAGDDGAAAADLLEAALEMERAALALEGVGTVADCSVRKTVYCRRVLNSKLLDRYLENTYYTASVTLQSKREEGKAPFGSASVSVHRLDALSPSALAAKALANADRMDGGGTLANVKLPPGRWDAVLSSKVVCNIMATAWQCFSGERILSGSSAFSGKTGELIASPALTIVDDPVPGGWAVNLSLDSEGSLCRPRAVVSGGRLAAPLHTLGSAGKAGCGTTGNAGRVAGLTGTTPINLVTIPSAIYIRPGDAAPEELLCRMKDGVYLTYSLDAFHSINTSSGEFSIPCGGILYRDGRAVGTVNQITMAGNLKDFLRSIRAVGKDLELEEFIYYHNFCFGGPSLLAEGVTFAGMQ